MSEENPKTPLDHVADTLSQLKEMHHYAKNNVELLTTEWLMFDGELSKLKQAAKIENLMMRQSEFHDALETVIAELEEVIRHPRGGWDRRPARRAARAAVAS